MKAVQGRGKVRCVLIWSVISRAGVARGASVGFNRACHSVDVFTFTSSNDLWAWFNPNVGAVPLLICGT
jgi:hypothetical protein